MPSLSTILAGALGVVGLALVGVLTIWVPNLYDSRAMARAALESAVKANVTNQATIDRLEADVVIAQAAAIADAQERAKLEKERDALADAGRTGGLDAILECRRLQLQGRDCDGNPRR